MTTVAILSRQIEENLPRPGQTAAQAQVPLDMGTGIGGDKGTYFPSSYWRNTIPDRTPYDDSTLRAKWDATYPGRFQPGEILSDAYVRTLCDQAQVDRVRGGRRVGGVASLAWLGPSNPLYVVPRDQPDRTIQAKPSMHTTVGGGLLADMLKAVPLPEDAITQNPAIHKVVTTGPNTTGSFDMGVYYDRQKVGVVQGIRPSDTPKILKPKFDAVLSANGLNPTDVGILGQSIDVTPGLEIRFKIARYRLLKENDTCAPPIKAGDAGDRWANVFQPSKSKLVELFSVSPVDPTGPLELASWGGVIDGHTQSHFGTFANRYDIYGRQLEHQQWGGNACSMVNLPWIDLDVLRDCISRNIVYPSAIPLSLGHAQATPIKYLWPATRGDGIEYGRPDMIPEGARISLHPSKAEQYKVWLATKVSPEWLPVVRAIMGSGDAGVEDAYGAIPRDKTGSGVNLQLRGYMNYPGKSWPSVLTRYATDGNAANWYMMQIPWHLACVVHPEATGY